MFRMREGLKLARLRPVFHSPKELPFACLLPKFPSEIATAPENFRLQSGGFARFLNRGKIDVRGEVLLPDVGQKVVAGVMAEIGAERACVRPGENSSSAVKP